jgi:hypothetical protein
MPVFDGMSSIRLPDVTVVFCAVDGGKLYGLRNRRDFRTVHTQLVALARSVLRQVR